MDVNLVASSLVNAIAGFVKRKTSPLEDRIAALEARVSEAEKSALEYFGVWDGSGPPYRKGAAVTLGGSLWIALRSTSARPGADDSWQLAVKRGRDAPR